MGKYTVERRKIPRLFLHFVVLLSLEWAVFILYIAADSNTFFQKNELDFMKISNENNKSRAGGRLITLQPIVKQKKSLEEIRMTTVNFPRVQNCTKKEVKLSKIPLPETGLVGFPGTGSTWVRHLIQQMTGIGTSSMYCDGGLKLNGFPFECVRTHGSVLMKTHEETHFKFFKKIVLLIRNPYEAMLAYFSWKKGGHTGHPSKRVLLETSNKMFDLSIWWYVDLINGTLARFNGPVHVLQYERLKTDMTLELRKLSTFLQVNVTDHDIACTVTLQEGNFHRKTKDVERLKLLRTIFDEEKLQRLKNATAIVGKLIKDKLDLNVDVGDVEKLLF